MGGEIAAAALPFEDRMRAGKASNYMRHFGSSIEPGRDIVLMCRVSKRSNEGHLTAYVVELWNACREKNVKVVDVFRDVQGAYSTNPKWEARLIEVGEKARRCNAVVLATETNRFIRNQHVISNDRGLWGLQATEEELQFLQRCMSGVDLMTLGDPDATPGSERSEQTQRGLDLRAAELLTKAGRRNHLMQIAIQMQAAGFSLRKIEAMIEVPFNTVKHWCDKSKKRAVPFCSEDEN